MNKILQKLFISLLLIVSFTSCSKEKKKNSSKSDNQTSSTEEITEEVVNDEETVEQEPTYQQNFENFEVAGNWFLSDFGLNGEVDKALYTQNGSLMFDIKWTKKTRNQIADELEYERSEMTHEFVNSICEPKIEIGKENIYTNNHSDNLIAELDSDLNHCDINNVKPATISIRSFIPTQIGHKYKVRLKYRMRSYQAMTDKSYKNLIVRFGPELEKFDPHFESFTEASIEIIAINKFSTLTITDNGLPDSFGILIDDIEIYELGQADNYSECEQNFRINSKGFKKCIQGEIETDKTCDLSEALVRTSTNLEVATNRRNISNLFTAQAPENGNINFFSLGLKGKINISCTLNGHSALMPIESKTLFLREISWNNKDINSYPELAKIRIQLEQCFDNELNKIINLGTIGTNEVFSFTFNQDDNGRSFAGCKMNKLLIKDITPNGPSTDGVDINSIQIF